jgi:hypothetical protein
MLNSAQSDAWSHAWTFVALSSAAHKQSNRGSNTLNIAVHNVLWLPYRLFF